MANPRALPCGEGAIGSHAPVPACAARKRWVLTAAILGSAIATIDESVVNVALPQIEHALRTTLPAMQWVINAYTLCMTALMLAGGAAADQFGRRRIYLLGVAIFALASLGCGLAMNVPLLLAARVVQGLGAALLVPCSLALIGAAFGARERGAAIGIWSGATAMAAGIAPLLGGWLVDHWSWRAIFLINPVLALPTLWITLSKVPESRDPNAPAIIDWRGTLLAFAGLGSLAYGLISSSELGWTRPAVIASLVVGGTLLLGLLRVEQLSRWPMMPLVLFRSRAFSGINLLTLLLYGALGGAFFFVPFLLIQADGYSATAAGAAYVPFTLILGLLSKWSGGLLDRFGARRPLMVGPLIAAAGFLLLSGGGPFWVTIAAMSVLGFGMTIVAAPLTAAVLNAVPSDRSGVASGINNAVATLGGLLVVAILGGAALSTFNRSLDQHLEAARAAPAVSSAVSAARGALTVPSLPAELTNDERHLARTIVVSSLLAAIRVCMWSAAALALLSALVAAVTLDDRTQPFSDATSAPRQKPAAPSATIHAPAKRPNPDGETRADDTPPGRGRLDVGSRNCLAGRGSGCQTRR